MSLVFHSLFMLYMVLCIWILFRFATGFGFLMSRCTLNQLFFVLFSYSGSYFGFLSS